MTIRLYIESYIVKPLTVLMLTFALHASAFSGSLPVSDVEKPETAETLEAPVSAIDIAAAVDSIVAAYDSDWQELSMQGKLSFDGLPVRPNVKIYMKRGESVIMSARAPIFGEVARVEINTDSVTCINKHSRTYCSYPLDSIASGTPGLLADLQDILLGQFAMPGSGRMTPVLAGKSEWLGIPSGGVMIYPGEELQLPGTECAFIMNPEVWELLSFALMLPRSRTIIETSYEYGIEGWTLGLRVSLAEKQPLGGELQLSYPDYAPTPLAFTDAGSRYRKTDFRGLMRF